MSAVQPVDFIFVNFVHSLKFADKASSIQSANLLMDYHAMPLLINVSPIQNHITGCLPRLTELIS